MLDDILKTQQAMLATLAKVETHQSHIREDIKDLREEVKPLKAHVMQMRGGGKLLSLLATAIAIGTAFYTFL